MPKSIFKAENIKLHRSMLLYLHLAALIIFPLLIGVYYGSRKNLTTSANMVDMFNTILALISPLAISIVVSVVFDREEKAGNFQNWLTQPMTKGKTIMGQLIFYWLLYVIEVIGTNLIYYLVLTAVYHVTGISFLKLFSLSIVFAVLGFLQYEFAELVSLKWNIGGSLILGFFGSVISMLGVTSLFDLVWPFIPWAWQSRLTVFWRLNIPADYVKMATLSYLVPVILTAILSWLIFRYFNHWQGTKK
ncbi:MULTISPECIES: lantibiotic immunity ABC transporter MutG family permease subunit [unclassified Lactobacillus]|uniref:lantibiotic immunity ABC transporter MutG family permease subunit n=1 Tax=unclassified Lactobacillus TaxID=2620435 RepID=UPI00226AB225|nr:MULTISPECIES: lantibiotic immunity ABC transporter MutG family permease subunit [unclassified Lactobacillus]MCX8722306.1 lantibiotic immunity ABC transporter MutG family permease subunit [Lactobacillus sp. B4010]MCX8732330.1 lantibiotic immunity ABC transporter MutG family permease subunit [Lactobacillus sp. B4015]MCX8734475.1 lantibiotic immunity ABC transporter MutG family permease subunit [Lactobacillus sp. B4012]